MPSEAPSPRDARMHFRVDGPTKALIERAAALQNRKVTDYCLGVLADAAKQAVVEAETLSLTEHDRAAFFDALIEPPARSDRLDRAFAAHGARVVRD